jgi:catechol 2,3-dioxygenase-like lactoylglutathione lyase family enzyme
MKSLFASLLAAVLASCGTVDQPYSPGTTDPGTITSPRAEGRNTMNLGAFSVSLTVKDLAKSRAFYEKLGFNAILGEPSQNWLILQNRTITIGLFQGMFERNILTFNPGWANDGQHPEEFTDVREIQRMLEERGLELNTRADESTTGPASLMLIDPDGNPILFDQHV